MDDRPPRVAIVALPYVFMDQHINGGGQAVWSATCRRWKWPSIAYQRYARIVAKAFRAQPGLLEDVMDGLFHIALADGIVTAEEAEFLETVASVFGFSEREYRRIRNSHLGQDADDPYLILGVDPDISDKDLKTAYRRQAASNHPDRLMARGLPREMIGIASRQNSIPSLGCNRWSVHGFLLCRFCSVCCGWHCGDRISDFCLFLGEGENLRKTFWPESNDGRATQPNA